MICVPWRDLVRADVRLWGMLEPVSDLPPLSSTRRPGYTTPTTTASGKHIQKQVKQMLWEWTTRINEPRIDEPRIDEPRIDEPQIDEPRIDEPRIDEPQIDEPRIDEPQIDEPQIDEPRIDEPRIDEPCI